MRKLTLSVMTLLLVNVALNGCTGNNNAPVVNGWRQSYDKQGSYTVQPGDTLYSIAWRFGYDYQELAKVNHLNSPYSLKSGQTLYLVPPQTTVKQGQSLSMPQQQSQWSFTPNFSYHRTKPSAPPANNTPTPAPISSEGIQWVCPSTGKLDEGFSSTNKGVNIVNGEGTSVLASAKGEVVYSGNGLSGYGNLIIIKHSGNYLSAYAHNEKNLVGEGDTVKAGQPIALMGHTGAEKTLLHYEVRYKGKPVNPYTLLPKTCFTH